MSADSKVVAVQERRELAPLTAMALLERRELVTRVIDEVMVEGVHYGQIPGTPELSLLKEGAEVLLSTFNIAVEPTVTDLCTNLEVRFQVECRGIHMGTGGYVGSGIGVCSSNEEKYRWRKARGNAEYEAADLNARRIKYGRSRGGQEFQDKQVRQSPWDVFHTIMSMAKKRAMVDLAKTSLAASECLKRVKQKRAAQNAGPPAGNQSYTPAANATRTAEQQAKTAATAPSADAKPQDKPRAATPTPLVDAEAPISDVQVRHLLERIDRAGVPENAFLARFELGRVEDLDCGRFQAADAWISANSA